MFNSLSRQEVSLLLQERSAASLLREEGARLDDNVYRELEARAALDDELDSLKLDLEGLIPNPPEVYEYLCKHTRPPVWWRRPVRLPVWSLSLAASVFTVVIVAMFLKQPTAPAMSTNIDVVQALAIQRDANVTADYRLQQRNLQLFEALMDRATYWMDQETVDAYQQALADLEQALALSPNNPRCLQYLVLVCEALELDERLELYRSALAAL